MDISQTGDITNYPKLITWARKVINSYAQKKYIDHALSILEVILYLISLLKRNYDTKKDIIISQFQKVWDSISQYNDKGVKIKPKSSHIRECDSSSSQHILSIQPHNVIIHSLK